MEGNGPKPAHLSKSCGTDSLNSIVKSAHFVFLVGKDHVPLTLHQAVVYGLSEPLTAMMTNDRLKESQERVATLEDTEMDVFVGFAEFLYTGQYNTPQRETPAKDKDTGLVEAGEASNSSIRDDVGLSSLQNDDPDALPGLVARAAAPGGRRTTQVITEVDEHGVPLTNLFQTWQDPWGTFESPVSTKKRSARRQPAKFGSQHNNQLWDSFCARQFPSQHAKEASKPELAFHAKLYAFAAQYLVEPLCTQCLKSLHRDLTRFSLDRESASVILDLLQYTYANTHRREEERSGGSGAEGAKDPHEIGLRELVMEYVACQVRTLSEHERFREVLESDAEMGSDLVLELTK